MKAVEIRKMSEEALSAKLVDLKAELFHLRFQHAINQLENPKRIKAVKKRHCQNFHDYQGKCNEERAVILGRRTQGGRKKP